MEPSVKVTKRKRNRFTPEYKAEAVRVMRSSDKPVAEVAKDLGLSEQSLYRWARQLDVDVKADPSGPLMSAEREELARLRRELRQVQQERDFLKNGSVLREGKTVSFQVIELTATSSRSR